MNILAAQIPDWLTMKCEAMRLRLDGVEVFKKLTQEQKDNMWNQNRMDRLPIWLKDSLSSIHRCIFPAMCICYFDFIIGGTVEDFYDTNKKFKKNMKTCLKDRRKELSFFEYHLIRWKIHKTCNLIKKHGLPRWKTKNP